MRTLFIEDREEINKVIRACKTCYVAMSVDNQPYVLPMNFALEGDTVILHSAQSGRMWESLQKNPNVCINWTLGEELAWQDVRVGCSYRVKSQSVNVEGPVEIVEDYDEKYRLLGMIMGQYSNREFKFNKPAVANVGIMKVHIKNITGKVFGAKAIVPGRS
ncbi:pyridoxamine 5'-phosphate oxidase family protein [Sunxiuqinia sp. A32]|uniref:pyridoxamine 5'-phosphate oxidase family protein n=1 Tax=Sunxiuqinia sp. A32 TaxID=3461496 RepID=UPI004045DA20